MSMDRLKDVVFSRQKTLARIYETFGGLSLADYAAQWTVGEGPKGADRDIFFQQLRECAATLHGHGTADGVARQLAAVPLVSTIDHHGIFGHPFFLNSNLIHSLRGNSRYLVCLPTAGVSLNNNTSWSGCLLLTGPDGRVQRFSFFPDRVKMRPVLATDSFGPDDVRRVLSRLKLGNVAGAGFVSHCQEIFQDSHVLGFKDFSSQAAVLSGLVWKKVFPDAPELVYIPLEKLVSRIVAGPIARDKSHLLHRLFFTAHGWDSVEKYFQGSLGAFTSRHKGSFLFWGIDNHRHRVHLARAGEKLVSHDLVAPADPAAIAGLMEQGRLYPTSLMCFMVLLYYGVTALGGFNQVNWLTEIKQKLVALLEEWGEADLASRIALVAGDNFAESNLAFGVGAGHKIYKPTAWDLLLHSASSSYSRYHLLAKGLTVGESLLTQLPEIYKVITPAADRDAKLSAITEADIIAGAGLGPKILDSLSSK